MKRGRTFPTEAHNIQVIGLAGSGRVQFKGQIPHGKNRHGRYVTMDIHPDQILAIADALRATAGHACCDPKYDHCDLAVYERMFANGHCEASTVEAHRFKVGHAIWHLDNPDSPMPCRRGRGEVIDIEEAKPALPPCTACATRSRAGLAGQCPACANERTRSERAMERALAETDK